MSNLDIRGADGIATGKPGAIRAADPWAMWLRRMVLRENQIRGTLERHVGAVPEGLRESYSSLIRLSEARVRTLEAALMLRGEKGAGLSTTLVRSLGRLSGGLTAWGGARRVLSMDIDGVRSLERSYFEAYHEKPPTDLCFLLSRFIGELEKERASLVELSKPLFAAL